MSYNIWYGMIARCTNPKLRNYKYYGARGITVCERWSAPGGIGFKNFIADMGNKPNGKSLDRINNEEGYFPGNCRWATPSQQAANTRRTKNKNHEDDLKKAIDLYDGYGLIKPSITAVAKHFKIDRSTLSKALKRRK